MSPPSDTGELYDSLVNSADRRNFLKGTAVGLATGLFTPASLAQGQTQPAQLNLRLNAEAFSQNHVDAFFANINWDILLDRAAAIG